MRGRETAADPVFAGPLLEKGLLRILEPETFVDQDVTEKLIAAVTELVTQGAFDDLDRPKYGYAELSRSRIGWDADIDLSEMITEELISRGLARPSEDGVSVPLHPVVRKTFLVLLSQLARDAGRRQGLDLSPTTVHYQVVDDLIKVLSLQPSPSAGQVVTLDLETVGLNLASVPLEEILEFRGQHGNTYREYARNVRQAITELSLLAPEERQARLLDRREELADLSNDLRKTASRAWKRPLTGVALGAAGAAWMVVGQHDPLGAALALSGVLAAIPGGERTATAYSYIIDCQHTLGTRS
jgi:hypothetical protein